MWLRDSQNQVLPYFRDAKTEPEGIGSLLKGLLYKHIDAVLHDSYANSISFSADDIKCNKNPWLYDNTTMLNAAGERVSAMTPEVHQRKWEMDSLASTMKLARLYYESTHDAEPFDEKYLDMLQVLIDTYEAQRAPLTPDNYTLVNYTFQTETHEPKDTSAHGIGRNHRWTGLIRTSFLPSDDSPRFPYHIPGNAFAAVELNKTSTLLRKLSQMETSLSPRMLDLADQARALSNAVNDAIQKYGLITHALTGEIVYAMEVDGFGNYFFADDANVPSLLSLPFLEYTSASDPIYLSTRKALLDNSSNPYFYGNSKIGEMPVGGIGSEDASGNNGQGFIWPLSLAVRLMTLDESTEEKVKEAKKEAEWILQGLLLSAKSTGLIHESYWYSDATRFTRSWFAMGNSLFAEALLRIIETHPDWVFAN
eukprot:g3882.t1